MTVENVYQRKRKVVYATGGDEDANLDVFKRRRTPVLNGSEELSEPLSDDERRSTPLGESGSPRPIPLPSLDSLGVSPNSDSEDEDSEDEEDRSNRLPETVSLRQSVGPEDIERVKAQNVGKMQGTATLLDCDDSIEDALTKTDSRSCGELDGGDRTQPREHKSRIRREYNDQYGLPPILYLSDLLARIQPLLSVVEDMYKHRVHSPYKFEATAAREASNSAVLSLSDFRSMNINKFVAGYYGLKRQLSVGEEILRHFKAFLLRRQGKTMNWWGLTDFTNYVLAPEVLASLCIVEMNLGDDLYDPVTREKAYDMFHCTVQFGLVVADTEPLEHWEAHVEHEQLDKLDQGPTRPPGQDQGSSDSSLSDLSSIELEESFGTG